MTGEENVGAIIAIAGLLLMLFMVWLALKLEKVRT